MATAAQAQEPAPSGDIIVTGERPDACADDWWCTSVSREDFENVFNQPEINPLGDGVGDGGGNQIVVTADREEGLLSP